MLDISIHSLVKRETQKRARQCCSLKISIHSLVKRETRCFDCFCGRNHNFNPLPRKEGDACCMLMACRFNSHFNPLPRKEGDFCSPPIAMVSVYFNPLPRKEGDITRQGIQKMRILISIHSLVKRETHDKMHVANFPGYFNPLPRKEGDRRGLKQRKLYQLFQSTPS